MYCTNRDCPDFAVTGRHGEYRDDIMVCPYCGEALEPTVPADDPPPDVAPSSARGRPGAAEATADHDDLEPVFETSDPTEVPVVRSFLDAQGIPHVVIGEDRLGAFRGSLSPFRFKPRTGAAAFLVPSAYAELARELLVEIEDTSGSDD